MIDPAFVLPLLLVLALLLVLILVIVWPLNPPIAVDQDPLHMARPFGSQLRRPS